MSIDKKMYSVGHVAKLTNVSIRQLYYLEEKGLLIPSERNRENNYRYYSHEQLIHLVFIKTLRELGLPFEDVVKVMEEKDSYLLLERLDCQMEKTAREIRQAHSRYERLSMFLTQIGKGRSIETQARYNQTKTGQEEFYLVDVPKKTVMSLRQITNVSAQELFMERFFELHSLCQERHLPLAGSMEAIFWNGYMQQFSGFEGDLETFFPIEANVPLGGNLRQFGGFKGVCAVHIGHYTGLDTLYRRLEAWAKTQKLELMAVSVEEYVVGPDMTLIPENYVTRVVVPLKGSNL